MTAPKPIAGQSESMRIDEKSLVPPNNKDEKEVSDENLEPEEKVKVNEREEKQPRLRGHLKIKPTDEVG